MADQRINKLEIRFVEADRVRPIRQRVLRPHQTIQEMVYPGDDAPGALHLAVVDETHRVVGIASFYRDPHPHGASEGDWRLRGMAVEPQLQGMGLGGRLVQVGLDRIREQGGRRLWCNARVTAQRFYEKLGFVEEGECFDIPTIGPHYVMSIAVDAKPR